MRTASSMAISSNGFIDILILAVSMPLPSALTRIFTLKSMTRFIGTSIFTQILSSDTRGVLRSKRSAVAFEKVPFRNKAGSFLADDESGQDPTMEGAIIGRV